MKRFLTCTAAAAFLAAPAHAESDGYEYGYGAGIAITSCVHYAQGNVTHTEFLRDVRRARRDLDSYAADALIHAFEDGAKDPESSSVVRRAFRKCHSATKHLLSVRPVYGENI